jgi:hypothetical protein
LISLIGQLRYVTLTWTTLKIIWMRRAARSFPVVIGVRGIRNLLAKFNYRNNQQRQKPRHLFAGTQPVFAHHPAT